MNSRNTLLRRPAPVALVLTFALSCGGSSNPPTAPPTSVALPAPTPTPPTPVQGCALGKGSPRYTCQGDVPGLQPRLIAAIDKLVKDRPQLFHLEDDPGATDATR